MIPISTDDVHELSTASSPDGNLPTKPAEVDTKLAEDTNSVEHNGKNEVGEVKEEDSTLSHREKGLEADTGATDSRVRAPYIVGWRLYALTFSMCMSLLLSTLETTIVSTSLVSISNSLQSLQKSGWIVTSYMLTYTGFLVIYAKFSDIFGRKIMLIFALTIFTAASIACGAAQTMVQLIVFRAFQGIGGSGIYSMVSVITPEMVSPEFYGPIMGVLSSVFAISSLLGPILGGVINDRTTWRWVFLLNAPAGSIALALVVILLPRHYPFLPPSTPTSYKLTLSKEKFQRLDWPGMVLSLAGSILLVFALEQAGTVWPWKSARIIAILVLTGFVWIAFFVWERGIESWTKGRQEAVFPWRLVINRLTGGLMLIGFLMGFPFMAAIFDLPQRFQAVNGLSPSGAGFRMLPLLLCSPIASATTGFLSTKLNLPPFYILIGSGVLQIVGVSLLSSLSDDRLDVPPQQYGYQAIMGLGFGSGLTTLLVMTGLTIEQRDLAVAMGSITQVRVLGGTIGLAICSSLLNQKVRSRLSGFLTPDQLSAVLDSTTAISQLSQQQSDQVRLAYASGFKQQMVAMAGITGLTMIAMGMLWENPPRKMSDKINETKPDRPEPDPEERTG